MKVALCTWEIKTCWQESLQITWTVVTAFNLSSITYLLPKQSHPQSGLVGWPLNLGISLKEHVDPGTQKYQTPANLLDQTTTLPQQTHTSISLNMRFLVRLTPYSFIKLITNPLLGCSWLSRRSHIRVTLGWLLEYDRMVHHRVIRRPPVRGKTCL